MRIALFSWETLHSINVGGIAAHVTELAAALERKGHEVHVFTRSVDGKPFYERIDGIHHYRCPFDLNPDLVDEIGNMCRSFVHYFLQTEDFVGHFDIIHVHDWLCADAGIWIKEGKGHGKKMIMTIHSTEYGRCGNHFWQGQSARIREHERRGTYCADRVVAVSYALKKEVMWMYNLPDWKVSMVYNGVNCKNFDVDVDPGEIKKHYGIGPLDPTVLFVGRMAYQKGPDLLVQAIPYILKCRDNAKFVFAGDGGMRPQVEDMARKMGVAHATRFLGQQDGYWLPRLYKAADLVCVPSRNEPFGIVILEAWSAGKPVVASCNGGPAEFVWHDVTGLQIYAQPESVAWGIGTIFADWDHARWMGQNGRQAVETAFTWDRIADQVVDVYHA